MKYDVDNIEGYLNAIPSERRPQLIRIMKIIQGLSDEIQESYEHGMPFYRVMDDPLFALASQKHYMALYIADPEQVQSYKNSIGKVNLGKNCVRFKHIDNLELDMVEELLAKVLERKLRAG